MNITRRGILAAALVAAGAWTLACGGDDVINPVPGTLQVSLTTPNPGADGAILFSVGGPTTPTAVAAGGVGLRAFSATGFGTNNRFIVTGTLTNGTILTINVPDVNGTYTATLMGVSATDYQLRSPAGYSLTIVK